MFDEEGLIKALGDKNKYNYRDVNHILDFDV